MDTYFALVDENNIVTNVLVVPVEAVSDINGNITDELGTQYCQQFYMGKWIHTERDGSIRKNYAGIGYQYDTERDAFIAPKPFHESVLDEETCRWYVPEEVLLAYQNRTIEDTIPPQP